MTLLIGWKDMAKAAGVHVRTLKRWHYELKKIPFKKNGDAVQARPTIFLKEFETWIKNLMCH